METKAKETIFRVKSTTSCPELGSAIAHAISDGNQVVLKAVGAQAVNQAVKAVPIAQSYVISFGVDLVQRITFFHGQIDRAGAKNHDDGVVGVAIRVMAL